MIFLFEKLFTPYIVSSNFKVYGPNILNILGILSTSLSHSKVVMKLTNKNTKFKLIKALVLLVVSLSINISMIMLYSPFIHRILSNNGTRVLFSNKLLFDGVTCYNEGYCDCGDFLFDKCLPVKDKRFIVAPEDKYFIFGGINRIGGSRFNGPDQYFYNDSSLISCTMVGEKTWRLKPIYVNSSFTKDRQSIFRPAKIRNCTDVYFTGDINCESKLCTQFSFNVRCYLSCPLALERQNYYNGQCYESGDMTYNSDVLIKIDYTYYPSESCYGRKILNFSFGNC